LKIIRPIKTICDHIVSSNVPLVEPLYSAATTYSKGNRVVNDPCGAVAYESLANANTGQSLTDPAWWLPIGSSNYYAMFDDKNGTQTTNPDSIEIEVTFGTLVNSVALINVEANKGHFEAWNEVNQKVLDITIDLRDYSSIDYYQYFFDEITFLDRYISFEVPTMVSGRGKLTLTNTGGIAKLGGLIYGNQFVIGKTLWGVSLGIRDFSTKETDIFGNYIVVPRSFQDKVEADVFIEANKIGNVRKVLSQYRTAPVVWAADTDYDVTITYGYYRDFSIVLSNPLGADCSIQIEGLS
jgi:hypothetical protein